MSYCRWSCDNHRSDVYAYESRDGFKIYVTSVRDLISPVGYSPYDADFLMSAPKDKCGDEYRLWQRQWEARQRIYDVWAENRVTVPIGLPHDGENFTFSTENEMFEKLRELSAMGYHVPAHAFESEKGS